jgi:hypothetical protein
MVEKLKIISNHIKVTLILGIAFIIMLAALIYNPQGTGEDDLETDDNSLQVTVHGTVTDGNGMPLNDPSIWTPSSCLGQSWAAIDENGSYRLVFNTTVTPVVIVAGCDGYSSETASIHPKLSNAEFEENFTLCPNQNVSLPLGIVSIIDSPDGSSNFTLSINMTSGYYDVREVGSNETISFCFAFQNLTYLVPVGNGPTMLYMNVSMRLCYEMEGGDIFAMSCDAHGPIYGIPLSSGNQDMSSGSWNRSTLSLEGGDQANVTLATKNVTYQLPSNDITTFSLDFGGRTLTYQEVNLSAGNIDMATGTLVNSSVTAISVSITPLTEGNHSYDVYAEDGCVIFIKEIRTS